MSRVLEVNNLYKKIGNKKILNGINLRLEKGKVLGILGPNGNGKTTLLNSIAGLIKATSGEILINEEKIQYKTRNMISFLQEKSVLCSWMTINDAIQFHKNFYNDFDEKKANELLKFMNLDRKLNVKSLSKGMLEKLNLSLTLSRNTQLYILDEPISGVDILSREKIIDAIIQNISEDSSMIITTHYVGELEGIFDKVVFLNEGKIVEGDEAETLREKYNKSIEDIYKYIFAE